MKEREYINLTAMSTIRASIAVLRQLVPENIKDSIDPKEYHSVMNKLYEWQERIKNKVHLEEETKKGWNMIQVLEQDENGRATKAIYKYVE